MADQLQTFQKTVPAAAPILLVPGGQGCFSVFNLGGVDVWLGSSVVTPTTGILLPGVKGACLKFESCDELWAVTAAGTQAVAVAVGVDVGLFFFGNAGAPNLQKTVVTYTQAQLASLTAAVFLPFVPAPAAGQYIQPICYMAEYIQNTINGAATGTLTFFWGATVGANFAFRALNANNFVNLGASEFAVGMGISETDSGIATPKSVVDGQPILIGNSAAVFNTGDGSVRFTIYYGIETSV